MPTLPNPRIFIVVPAYNEAELLPTVVGQLLRSYSNVVVVDDGSVDGTADALADQPVHLLRHIVNRGQGAALQTGIRHALQQGADIIITFDADGQHGADDIQTLVEPIVAGNCDITLGSRFIGKAHNIPLRRRLMLKGAIYFTRLVSGIKITDVHNGLRAFSRPAASSLQITMDRMAHASEILDQVKASGFRYKEVPVNIYYSEYSLAKGQSSWNAIRIAMQVVIDRVTK